MRSAIRDPGEFAACLEASKLPFLHAAILETLRLLTGPLSIRVAAAPFAHGPYVPTMLVCACVLVLGGTNVVGFTVVEYHPHPPPPKKKNETAQTIPAGMMIGLSPYHDHHDAGVFDRPDEFLPERFLRTNRENVVGPLRCILCRHLPLQNACCVQGAPPATSLARGPGCPSTDSDRACTRVPGEAWRCSPQR